MKKDFLKYGNFVAFIAVVVFNILATMGVLGGVSTRDVSYMYRSLLTPADYAFSIWSIIYILLMTMVILQIKNEEMQEKLGIWFIISCVLNIAWLFTWQFKYIALSFILIFALLLNLIMLMRKMNNYYSLASLSIGLYAGWINVAMLANLGALATRYNWMLFGISARIWAILGLIFGIVWISCFIFAYSNVFYAIGACWGYLGIFSASVIGGIRIMAIIGIVFFTASAIMIKIRKKMLT